MGDMGDFWRDIKEDRKERREKRNNEFARECFEAGQLAPKGNMFLKCLNQENYHYRLTFSNGDYVDFWRTGRYNFVGNISLLKNKDFRKALLNGPMATVKFIIDKED